MLWYSNETDNNNHWRIDPRAEGERNVTHGSTDNLIRNSRSYSPARHPSGATWWKLTHVTRRRRKCNKVYTRIFVCDVDVPDNLGGSESIGRCSDRRELGD